MGLILALVLLGQGFAAAHASSYGDTPHDHDGVVCDVTLISEELDELLPTPATALPAARINYPATPDAQVQSFTLPRPHGRAPPPRAPPHTHI